MRRPLEHFSRRIVAIHPSHLRDLGIHRTVEQGGSDPTENAIHKTSRVSVPSLSHERQDAWQEIERQLLKVEYAGVAGGDWHARTSTVGGRGLRCSGSADTHSDFEQVPKRSRGGVFSSSVFPFRPLQILSSLTSLSLAKMFYVIGLGLCDEQDITLRGLEVPGPSYSTISTHD